MRRSRFVSALAALTLAVLTAVSVTACGNDGSAQATADHNQADVSFVREMIPHHQQSLAMVAMTTDRDLDPEVVALAQGIRATQRPQITEMQTWLRRWSSPGSGDGDGSTDGGGGTGGDAGGDDLSMGGDVGGMMSSEQLRRLDAAPDGSFRRLWLQSMIEHHQGALGMARSEVAAGKFPPAVALAQSIVDTQTAEIAQMRALLAR